MPPNVTVLLSADELRLLRALDKVIAKEDKLAQAAENAGRRSERAGRDHGKSWGESNARILSGIGQIAGALGIGMGVGGAVQLIVSGTKEWYQNMLAIGQAAATAGREMTALALMQKEGQAGEAVRRAATAGAQFGVAPGEAWGVVQQLQAQTGGLDTGLAASAEAFKLAKYAGVEQAAAGRAVSLGMGLGETAPRAARGIYGAGELSSLSPEEMAQMAPQGLPSYRGTEGGMALGLGVAAQLSTVIKEAGQLGTYTARAQQALFNLPTGPEAKKREEAGITFGEDMDMFERLRALRGAGVRTEQDLEKVGFSEIRERRAVGILLADVEGLERRVAEVREMMGQEGLIVGKRAAAEAELPQLVHERRAARAGAIFAAEAALPPTPEAVATQTAAMEMDLQARARAIAMQRIGLKDFMPADAQESGVIGPKQAWWGRTKADILGQKAMLRVLGAGRDEDAAGMGTGMRRYFPREEMQEFDPHAAFNRILPQVMAELKKEIADAVREGAREGAQGAARDANRPMVSTNPEADYVSPGRDRRVVSLAPEAN